MLQDIFWAALHWTAEYQNWDWGIYSLNIALMIVFTYVETWGIIRQGRTIYEKRSTEAVESELFFYCFFYFLLCGLYGVRLHGVVIVLNSIITAIAQLYVLRAILHFRPFSERERRIGSVYALIPGLQLWGMSGGFDGWVYIVFAIGMWWALFEQLRKLWAEWVVGAVEVKLYFVYLGTCFVWAAYAFYIGDTFFETSMVGATVIIASIILLWFAILAGAPKPRLPARIRKRLDEILMR